MTFFKDIKVKYVDNKYIYLPVVAFLLVNIAASLFLQDPVIYIFILATLLLILLITSFHLFRSITDELEEERRQTQALMSIHSLLELRAPLPSMTKWAAKPDLAAVVLEYIQYLKPEIVVEAGSGVTSVVSCYTLEKNGSGKLTSLDHDEFYGSKTNHQLAKHGLQDIGKVHYAPLTEHSIEGESWLWYDTSMVDANQKIDMLVVDGPPVKTQGNARYPALPLFYESMSEKAVVVLDDAGRDSESEVVQMWLAKYPEFELDFRYSKKGIAVLHRGF